jgi:hypothetical protein
MTPTTRFRYIERDCYSSNGEHFSTPHRVRILQQWWEGKKWNEEFTQILSGEWRYIPLETEQ